MPRGLASGLVSMHELCSKYGSHADFNSFAHRVQFSAGNETSWLYFQKPDSDAEFSFYIVTILNIFVVVLNVFAPMVVGELGIVDSVWQERLQKFGAELEDWRQQLKEPKIASK